MKHTSAIRYFVCECFILYQQTQPQMKTYYFNTGGSRRPGFCIGVSSKVPASKGENKMKRRFKLNKYSINFFKFLFSGDSMLICNRKQESRNFHKST